jgi:hypothetical protein
MRQAPFDGNVTAGELADIFAFDATAAISTCATYTLAIPGPALR